MFRHVAGSLLASAFSLLMVAPAADAGDWQSLGYGRLMTNDYFGDGKDRWRTGSWTSSRVWGSERTGKAPASFGELIELRVSSEIFAPDNLDRSAAGDGRVIVIFGLCITRWELWAQQTSAPSSRV